jgi:trimethyllysine dioxygenase
MEKISYIRENIYGSVWDFTADMAMSDTAYSNIELKAHTDGSYFKDPPG